jgi:mRNA interferase MazF
MPIPGTVVTIEFRGAQKTKKRPAVVVSTDLYHANRPDVILAVITKEIDKATAPTDYVLQDWQAAGLHLPSAFRAFLETYPAAAIAKVIGRLSDRDWQEVQARLRLAIAV